MRKVFMVAGLFWGDEGKGSTTDYLCRRHGATLIVKYNGGPQNAHNVITPNGTHHCFHQFGAGSFLPNVDTHISQYALINPIGMIQEAEDFYKMTGRNLLQHLTIDGKAVIITPFQRTINRFQELNRAKTAHGSCGVGLGVARCDAIEYPDSVLRAEHLSDRDETVKRLEYLRDKHTTLAHALAKSIIESKPDKEAFVLEELNWFDRKDAIDILCRGYGPLPKYVIYPSSIINSHDIVIFEGSQGVLLSEGNEEYWPHVTWTDTTFNNAWEILSNHIGRMPEITKIGVMRTYVTRHGKGPLLNEDKHLVETMGEDHNVTNDYQGHFRGGWLDLDQLTKAVNKVGGIDEIALNHMDRLDQLASLEVTPIGFRCLGDPARIDVQRFLIKTIEEHVKVPVTILGYGPTAADRLERLPYLFHKK